jgi:hypothetical protein
MQVTSNLGTGNQSRYSNDSIAEFQFISNRFDATQGRSSGVQVNAITKSGTNKFSGSLVGNFRDSNCDPRGLGISTIDRLRDDGAGTIIPREGFVGQPIHRVEMRLQQRVPIGRGRSIDGFLEVFNLFNRANYGSYDTVETSPTFGHPLASANLSYAPRTLQLGFRVTF